MYNLFRDIDRDNAERDAKSKLVKERVLAECFRNTERIDNARDIRALDQIEAENQKAAEAAWQYEKRKQNERRQVIEEKAERDAKERHRETILEESIRKQIRSTEPELRELQRKILEGKVARERSIQIAHRMAIEENKRREEKQEARKLKEEMEKLQRESEENCEKERALKKKYHEALDEQRFVQQESNKNAANELREDREMINQLVKKIEEEDEEEVRKKREEQRMLREQMDDCQRAKLEVERQEQLRRAEEETKIADHRLMQEYRTIREEESRKTEMLAKRVRQERMMRELDIMEQAKIRNEELRTELAYQENLLHEGTREQIIAERKVVMAREVNDICNKQMWLKAQREELDRKEDELYMKVLMDRLYNEDKLATMNKIERKRKQKEHRELILDMIEERRQRIVKEKELQMAEYRRQKETEDLKRSLIEQERILILQENMGDLLGFVPKGVLKSDQDIERLGESFQKFYHRKPVKTSSDESSSEEDEP